MGKILIDFFDALALKFRNENDLSDVTWSMVQASPYFKEQWLHLFFPHLDIKSVDSIEREVWDNKNHESRADFVIRTLDGTTYVIEIKKGDTNHHFGKYEVDYDIPKERLGYIVNYPLTQDGYDVKQWYSFHEKLKTELNSVPDDNERELIAGYTEYLKNVCCIMEIEHLVDIYKMSGLYGLTLMFKKIIEDVNEDYETRPYRDMPDDKSKRISFIVTYKEIFSGMNFYPYIGIWYDHQDPRIYAGFWKDRGWCREICDLIDTNRRYWNEIPLKLARGPEPDWGYSFAMSEETITQFQSAHTVQEQIDILSGFLKEVLYFPLLLSRKAVQK